VTTQRTTLLRKLGLEADGAQLSLSDLAHLKPEEIVHAYDNGHLSDAISYTEPEPTRIDPRNITLDDAGEPSWRTASSDNPIINK
jgi:hypothetical protein